MKSATHTIIILFNITLFAILILTKLQAIHYDVIDIHEAVFTELLIEE